MVCETAYNATYTQLTASSQRFKSDVAGDLLWHGCRYGTDVGIARLADAF